MDNPESSPQRYMRPIDATPGHLKKQLPTKQLALAARGNLAALASLLLEHRELLNHRGPFNRTFLWEAARKGKLKTVQWLVERGADVNACGAYNNESMLQITPYCAAIYYRRSDVAAFLLACGAQTDIFRAAFLGDQERVLAELTTHPELLNAEDPFDSTYYAPLIAFAVKSGKLSLVQELLQRGAVVAPYSLLLLGMAASTSNEDMVKLLVSHGALLSKIDAGIFVGIDDLQLMRYLLENGVSVNTPGFGKFPPLIYLCRGDKGESVEKVNLLLEYGASVNAIGPKGRTALHYAATAGYLHVLSLLLEHGADPNIMDERGETPRSLAEAVGKDAVVRILSGR